jgi:hypothetical protein
MRRALGILLHFNGSVFAALGHVVWALMLAGTLARATPAAGIIEWLVILSFFVAAIAFVVMGELMSLFGLAMTYQSRPALHRSRPVQWFVINLLLSLTTSTWLGAGLAIPLAIIPSGPGILRAYPAVILVGLTLWLRQRLKAVAKSRQFEA